MKSLRFAFVALVTLSLVSLAASAAAAAPWKIAHMRPADSEIERELTWFADEMRRVTDGRIDIQIYGNSQLGDYTVVQERVGLGAVEMSCETTATEVDKRLLMDTIQYLFVDFASAKKNFTENKKFLDYKAKLFEELDIKVLAWWPVYFSGISLLKEPAAPTDPNAAQNCKVRVPTMKTFEVMATSLGYQATPLPFAEFFTAAQTGMVDGIIGIGAENCYASFRDLIKFYITSNSHFEIWPLLINRELYESLSDADRAALDAKAKEFEARRWVKAPEQQDYYVNLLEQNGTKIFRLTPEQLEAFAEKARPAVFDEFKKIVGEATFNEIFSMVEK